MVRQSNPDQTGIRARQVPQSVRFLRALGVPATRLAGIFGESADNIRHIDKRSGTHHGLRPNPSPLDRVDLALLKLTPDERKAQFRRNIQGLRLRSKQDLSQVEATVWAIFQNHQDVGLEDGYSALLVILSGVGNARHGQALRVRLLMEEKLAWFALQLEMIEAALAHAEHAMNLAQDAFRESAGVKDYLLRYSEAALVASVCLQKMHRPKRAFNFIRAADEANIAAGEVPGSEHLRQRGASFIHRGRTFDELANRELVRAIERMRRKSEARNPVDLAMIGLRQQAFLNPTWGWDKALELAGDVMSAYGERSMQYRNAAKSAALVGLKLATAEATETSLKLLDMISPAAIHGVSNILSITPMLKLADEHRDRWLRFAMNETMLPPLK